MTSAKKRVIFDTDPGTDDAFALLLLLHGEKLNLAKIEAIVCSNGNSSIEHTSKNLVRLLEVLNRTDIPVYKGATEAIIPTEPIPRFHGEDGFGDLEHATEPNLSVIQKEPGSVAMRNLVVNNPGNITLVCVGPLTNVALAMKLYDDFAPNIKEIFIMGGNCAAVGNAKGSAEYNFYMDPTAAQIVLNKAKCPITIAPWETCKYTKQVTLEWRFDTLGLTKNPFMELLNQAQRKIFSHIPPNEVWYFSDAVIVMALLYPEDTILCKNNWNATVELYGIETKGQVVLDHRKKKEPNVTLLEKINEEFAKNILLKAATEMFVMPHNISS